MRKLLLILLISFCFASTLAKSAEFFVLPGTKTLLVLGEIKSGDARQIGNFIHNDQVNTLIMKGPGGSLDEGMRIVDIVLREKLSIRIPAKTACASACAFIFAAGKTRIMEEGSRLGFHLPFVVITEGNGESYCRSVTGLAARATSHFFTNNSDFVVLSNEKLNQCLFLTYQKGLKDIKALKRAIVRDGISEKVIDLIVDEPSGSMAWINVDQARSLGLVNGS